MLALIRIKIRILISLCLCLITYQSWAETEFNEEAIFEKAFGKQNRINSFRLPMFYGKNFLGEVNTSMEGVGTIKSFSSEDLISSLKNILLEEEVVKIQNVNKIRVTPSDLDFKMTYDPNELRLNLIVSPDRLNPVVEAYGLEDRSLNIANIVNPAPISLIINNKTSATKYNGKKAEDFYTSNFLSALNVFGAVIENQSSYTSIENGSWRRYSTSIRKDNQANALTFKAGDINIDTYEFLDGVSLIGLSVTKNYSITPYEKLTTSNSYEYTLTGKSNVRYYINGIFVREEIKDSGKYSIKDLPLNSGLNTIKIEVKDEYGLVRSFFYSDGFSENLLREGLVRYSISAGKTSEITPEGRIYKLEEKPVVGGFLERGWTKWLTQSVYAQESGDLDIFGQKCSLVSKAGFFAFSNAVSKSESYGDGYAQKVTYMLRKKFDGGTFHDFGASVESRGEEFSRHLNFVKNNKKRTDAISYSHQLNDNVTLGLKLENLTYYSETDNSLAVGLDLRGTINRSFSYSLSGRSTIKGGGKGETSVGLYLNFNLPEATVSTSYDTGNKSSSLGISSRQNDNFTISGTVSKSPENTNSNLSVSNTFRYASISLRADQTKMSNLSPTSSFTSDFSTAAAFAYNDGVLGSSFGESVYDSAFIFKPSKEIAGQTVGLINAGKNSTPRLFGELFDGNITSYSYKNFQLDPTNMNEGYSLGQESFTFAPTYKSVGMVEVGKLGSVTLKGKLYYQNSPVANEGGELISEDGTVITVFTNGGGRFFIEGVPRGLSKIRLFNNNFKDLDIVVSPEQLGLINLGELSLLKK